MARLVCSHSSIIIVVVVVVVVVVVDDKRTDCMSYIFLVSA